MENLVAYLIAHQFLTSMIVLPIVLLLNIYLGWAIADFQGGLTKVATADIPIAMVINSHSSNGQLFARIR